MAAMGVARVSSRPGGLGSCRAPLVSDGWPRGRSTGCVGGVYPWGDGGWRKVSIRPVLKHGPRSLTCVRAGGWQTHEAQGN